MTHSRRTFPFSAIVGQDELKLALFVNAVDPLLGGALIRGERGSGRRPSSARSAASCRCSEWWPAARTAVIPTTAERCARPAWCWTRT